MATQTPDSGTEHTPSPLLISVGRKVQPLQAFFTKFQNDWSMNFSAALAYNLLTAMFPIAVALLSVVGLFLANQSDLHAFSAKILSIFPSQLNDTQNQDFMESIFSQLKKASGILGIIAFLVAIFGGSRLFIAIETFFSIIYRVTPRNPIRQNTMALGMLFLFIVLVPLLVFLSTAPSAILAFIADNPQMKIIPFFYTIATNSLVTYLATTIGGLFVGWILFQAIYMVVPNRRISFRKSWPGALIAAIALEIYLSLFGWYASNFMGGYVGQVGFAVILLTFFYYFAVIMLFGAEINAFFRERVPPLPHDIATSIGAIATHQQPDHATTRQSSEPAEPPQHIQKQEERQQRAALKALKARKQHAKKASRRTAIASVALGSILTIVAEMFRRRHHAR